MPRRAAPIRTRKVTLKGHKSNISLEKAFWGTLNQIAAREKMTVLELIEAINDSRSRQSLASAIRVYVLDYFMHASSQQGSDVRSSLDEMLNSPRITTKRDREEQT
jgi:predicted DNA-binding ribbon-helix-helix protein